VNPVRLSIFQPPKAIRNDFFAIACWTGAEPPVRGLPRAVSRAAATLRSGAPLLGSK